MTRRSWKFAVGLAVICFLFAPTMRAQQTSIDELKKQIEALSESVKAMQKDLQEIKALLQSRMPTPPSQNVVLDLAGHPARGENTARLILVEFSDYQ